MKGCRVWIKKITPGRGERGQSLVELSISLLVLLLILGGIVDLGRVLMFSINLRDAAQEGAQYGSLTAPDSGGSYSTRLAAYCNEITNRINSTGQDNFTAGSVMIDVRLNGVSCASAALSDACFGKEISVTITKPDYPITMPLLGAAIGRQSVTVSNTAKSTILRPSCP
jgi:Flp pilus assembly protein TadG